MGDARNRRRVEQRRKNRGESVYVPLVVTFCDVGVKFKQRVVLYCSDEPEPEPTAENIVAAIPVRGELPMNRKEEIVRKFVALASTCLLGTDEDSEDWEILGSLDTKDVQKVEVEAGGADDFWPSFLKDVDAKIDKKK